MLAHLDLIQDLKNPTLPPLLPFSLPLSVLHRFHHLQLELSLPHLHRQPVPIAVKRRRQDSQPLTLNKLILRPERTGRLQHRRRYELLPSLRCRRYSKVFLRTANEGRLKPKEENQNLPTSGLGRRCDSERRSRLKDCYRYPVKTLFSDTPQNSLSSFVPRNYTRSASRSLSLSTCDTRFPL